MITHKMNYINNFASNNLQSNDAALQLNNVEVLYTKIQKIYFKPQHKEERQRELRVNVEIHSGISPVCRKALCVLLSDDDDPCFLYSILLTEDDFKILKSQQGLLVDFDNFATQLICLLEQCNGSGSTSVKVPPKFLLMLAEESNEWIFKLVETNNFKHLCHLSLIISPATDSNIKTHMAIKIKQLKENLVNRCREVNTMETRLNSLMKELDVKTKDLDQLEQKFRAEQSHLQLTSSHQLNLEKDRLAHAKLEWQRIVELEKIEIERQHTETLQQLHTELAELRAQNISYKDKQSFSEATNKEQAKQLQNIEKELNVAQRDLAQLKKQNSKLDTDYREKDTYVNDLKTRVAVLEQELKDKSILITKHTEMMKSQKEQKLQLEELLSDKDKQVQRKQNALKNVSEEVIKANEIIKKLQSDLSSTKTKLKLRTSIALEQERLLDAKQKETTAIHLKISDLTKEVKSLTAESNSLKDQIKNLQSQIEEKDKTIKNNDNVINWLNRRLADSQSPLQSATTPAPIMIPSAFQLTLPRPAKYISNKYDTRTPYQNVPLSSSVLPSKNPVLQNSNGNQTTRLATGRSAVAGGTDSTVGLATFNRTGQITSTSTPMDRINGLSKLSSTPMDSATNPVSDNNLPISTANKSRSVTGSMQGGLRRAISEKPAMPSAYFPKNLH